MFHFTLGTQKQNKTNVLQNTLTSTIDNQTTCLAHRRTDVSPPLRCNLYRGRHADCSTLQHKTRAALSNLQCSTHWSYRTYSTIASTSVTEQRRRTYCAVGTFCMLSGGSKDSLLMCYNQPTNDIAQYYCPTILTSLHMESLTVRESKAPRILVSWLMS